MADLQKASFGKRIIASILDFILLGILAVGLAALLSWAFGYDGYLNTVEQGYTLYETEYGIELQITQQEYEALTPEQQATFMEAYEALSKDANVNYAYNMLINLTVLILNFSILFGVLVTEFIAPLIFKNGQTVGKKIFEIALINTATEWVAEANSKGGINFKTTVGSNTAYMGTNGSATSKFIRTYKEASKSSLTYGLVFFAKSTAPAGTPTATATATTTATTSPTPTTAPSFDATNATASEIVTKAYQLTGSETIQNATLTGTITAVNTPYDSGYKNITVTIAIEGTDKTMYCYRLTADTDKLDTVAGLAVGDKITVNGNIVVYNNNPQFAAGTKMTACVKSTQPTPTAPADSKVIVDDAFKLEAGGALPYVATLTGKVVSIDTEYSEDYKNITVTIEVEGTTGKKNIQCFRLKAGEGADASAIKVGDNITVTGNIINYASTNKVQFNTGATFVPAAADTPHIPETGDTASTLTIVTLVMAIAAAVVVVRKKKTI